MTLTLDLPPKLVDELATEAARLGLSVSEYAARVLSQDRSLRVAPRTGADLVAYWQEEGLVGTRPEIADSESYARDLRREAERRKLF
jgi:cyanophycinase-like exopeptidase